MATSSVIVQAKSQLLSQLQTALTDVQVTYSHPGDTQRSEGVYLGDARSDQRIPVSRGGGRARREEVAILEIKCVAVKPGDSLLKAETRAFELLAEVEDALADDPTIGGVATVMANIVRVDSVGFMEAETGQWGCEVTVEVELTTRLS